MLCDAAAPPSALWQPGGVGWQGGMVPRKGHVCTCGPFVLMDGGNQHDTVNQLSSNKIFLKKKKSKERNCR